MKRWSTVNAVPLHYFRRVYSRMKSLVPVKAEYFVMYNAHYLYLQHVSATWILWFASLMKESSKLRHILHMHVAFLPDTFSDANVRRLLKEFTILFVFAGFLSIIDPQIFIKVWKRVKCCSTLFITLGFLSCKNFAAD